MKIGSFDNLNCILNRAIETGVFPCAAYAVGTSKGLLGKAFLGRRMLEPERLPLTEDTLFDIASVTKVVATTTLLMLFQEKGLISTLHPVNHYLDGFASGEKKHITIRNLMTHTSGLPAHVRLDLLCKDYDDAIRYLEEMPLEYLPGEKVVYSCLGFILLGHILEKIGGERLDVLCQKYIFDVLEMKNTGFNPNSDNIAATELDESSGKMLIGRVHDENARFLGGISGNAGLFSNIDDLSVFAAMLLNNGMHKGKPFLSRASIAAMTSNYTPHLNEDRGLGWSLKGHRLQGVDVKAVSAGDLLSPGAFGHTGFTGTSVWIDPALDFYAILLTNRVHPTRNNPGILKFRPLFHNAAVASCVGYQEVNL